VTTRRREWPELCVMAFDHRSQLEEMALQCGASLKRIPALKQLILQASREAASRAGLEGKAGLLCDGTFGQDALNAITGEGWWIGRPLSCRAPGRWRWSTATSAPSLSAGRRSTW
jgi:5-dehydro-2-deoxygluconokinase